MSKTVWGPATWAMLHCLVLKIKDDANNIEEIKTLITSICDNLPCPYCTAHAKEIIKKSNFLKIKDLYVFVNILFSACLIFGVLVGRRNNVCGGCGFRL